MNNLKSWLILVCLTSILSASACATSDSLDSSSNDSSSDSTYDSTSDSTSGSTFDSTSDSTTGSLTDISGSGSVSYIVSDFSKNVSGKAVLPKPNAQ